MTLRVWLMTVASSVALLALTAGCSLDDAVLSDADRPVWDLGDSWVVASRHQRIMEMAESGENTDADFLDWTEDDLWDFLVDAEGWVDDVAAYRVQVSRSGDDDVYLSLYFRKDDMSLLRVEEVPTNHRGGAKRMVRNMFGGATAFPVVTDNALFPWAFPAFGPSKGYQSVRYTVEGFGGFVEQVAQEVALHRRGKQITLRRSGGLAIEQVWRTGEPWWIQQRIGGRSVGRLLSYKRGKAISHSQAFDIRTGGADLARMPLEGHALVGLWGDASAYPDAEAPGTWSGHWWPMLDGPGKTLLYANNGPMERYDDYYQARYGYNPGAQEWEYERHRTTSSHTGWWGHCNGFAAASILEDEPTSSGTLYGVNFRVKDKKGLLTEMHNGGGLDLWVGRRHYGSNGNDVESHSSYKDVHPYDFHRTIIQWIGIQGEPVVMDINPGYQVWNYPAYRYRIRTAPHPDSNKIRVETRVWFTDFASAGYVGRQSWSRTYYYWLTVDGSGDPVPGPSRWTGSSVDSHPDFIWHPSGVGTGNPIRYNAVRDILGVGDTQDPDDDHPNTANDVDGDDTIEVNGSALAGEIDFSGDRDYFRFEVEDNAEYTIETFDLGSGSDTYIDLYDSDGSHLGSDDDDGQGYASLLVHESDDDGYLYVRVRHYSPNRTGTYKIRVTSIGGSGGGGGGSDDDRPDSISGVTNADRLSASPISAQIEESGDIDYFALDATDGTTYVIRTSNLAGGMDTVMFLFDEDGVLIEADDDGGSGYASKIVWTAPTTDRYYVAIDHYRTSGTGSYKIRVD